MATKIRDKIFNLWLSEKEHALLNELAAEAEMSASAYIRQLIKRADEDRHMIRIPRKIESRTPELV